MAQRTCDVPGCERPFVARGYCDYHYREWRRCGVAGGTTPPPLKAVGTCSFDGCERRRRSDGLCSAHYLQQFHGRPLKALRPHVDTTARNSDGHKQCSRCFAWKSEASYMVNPRIKGGLHSFCLHCLRDQHLRNAYGITIDDYEQMLASQGGGCAICQRTNASGRNLYVDHDHGCCPGTSSCGQCVRALLCDPCNRAIGLMGDMPDRMESAAAYLRRHGRE